LENYSFVVQRENQDTRIDHYLVPLLKGVSRTRIQNLIKEGFITVNGEEIRANYRVKENDEIEVSVPPAREFKLLPEDIPLDIVFEDEYLLVINKPPGMVVHPAVGNWTRTLLNGLLFYLQKGGVQPADKRPGLVHRLDKDTSGLLIAAKDEATLNFMQAELKERRIKRRYQALVWGHLKDKEGKIELSIGRAQSDRRKMTVTERNAREAVTRYELLNRYKFADHLELALQTGRTHQIRVHLSHLGHPVMGDREYGGDEKILGGIYDQYRSEARHIIEMMPRQALHAYKLEFRHPKTGMIHTVRADLPEDIVRVIEYLKEIESKL